MKPERCGATTSQGRRCSGWVKRDGLCASHLPEALAKARALNRITGQMRREMNRAAKGKTSFSNMPRVDLA